MSVTPSGCVSQAQEDFRQLLALLPSVRTFLGVITPEAALARIHHDTLPPPADNKASFTIAELTALRPYVVISTPGQYRLKRDAEGVTGWYLHSGEVTALFEQTCGGPDPRDDVMRMRNTIGAVMLAIGQYPRSSPYSIDVSEMECDPPLLTPEDEVNAFGDSVQAELRITWGREP